MRGFKSSALRGNVVDLAVGVVAAQRWRDSRLAGADIISPILGAVSARVDFRKNLFVVYRTKLPATSLARPRSRAAVLADGSS